MGCKDRHQEGDDTPTFRVVRNTEAPRPIVSCKDPTRTNLCTICGCRWESGKTQSGPKRCPSCKSHLWNRDVRRYGCPDCGYSADIRIGVKVPSTCINCGSSSWHCLDETSMETTGMKVRTMDDRGFTSEMVEDVRKTSNMARSTAVSYLTDRGFEPVDAEVLVRRMNGDNDIAVANALNLSVGRVLMISGRMRRAGLMRD